MVSKMIHHNANVCQLRNALTYGNGQIMNMEHHEGIMIMQLVDPFNVTDGIHILDLFSTVQGCLLTLEDVASCFESHYSKKAGDSSIQYIQFIMEVGMQRLCRHNFRHNRYVRNYASILR